MDPAMAYHYQQQGYFPSPTPPSPYHEQQPDSIDEAGEEQTPFKYDPENMNNMSPYWSHLDQATLAMGLATPAKTSPSTPRRNENRDDDQEHDFAGAQAPLIRQHYYNNGYHHHATDGASNGYAPPSPATQFMMSPQGNASFAYNYGYGFSPRRPRLSKQLEEPDRSHSPSTVETTAESESDAAPPQPVEC